MIVITITSFPSLAHAWTAAEIGMALGRAIVAPTSGIAILLLDTVSSMVVGLLAIAITGLQWAIVLATRLSSEPAFLRDLWGLARNFTNMLFILGMVTMAYASILKIWPDYTIKKMLPQVLAVAILMNFSFAITLVGVKVSDNISTILLSSMKDMGDRIGVALIGSDTFFSTEHAIKTIRDAVFSPASGMTQRLLTIISYGFVALGVVIAFLFIVFRIIAVWMLLIASPLALFSYLIPSLRKKGWDTWVSEYVRWNTFLPTFLLILYVGLYILAQQGVIFDIAKAGEQGLIASTFNHGIGGLFFFLLVGFIFIQGTLYAYKAGGLAGSLASRGVAGLKDGIGITGAQRAWKAKMDEIGKGGLKGHLGRGPIGKSFDKLYDTPIIKGVMPRGQKAVDDSTKAWARRFGLSESQFAKNIGEEKKSLQDKDASIEALRDTLRKKNYEDPETFAAAQILLDKGKLSLDAMNEVYEKYAQVSPRAAKAFGDKVADKVHKQVEDGEIAGAENLNKAMELMVRISGGDGALLDSRPGEAAQDREKRLIAFEQKTEIARDRIRELLKKAKKKDPNWATERQVLRQTYEEVDERGVAQTKDYITVKNVEGAKLREVPGPLTQDQQFEQGLEAALSGLDSKALRELPRDLFEPKMENKIFVTQLLKVLESDRGRIGGIIKGATPEQRRKIEFWTDVAEYRALAKELGPVSAPLPSASVKLKGKALKAAQERQSDLHGKLTAPGSDAATKLFTIGIHLPT